MRFALAFFLLAGRFIAAATHPAKSATLTTLTNPLGRSIASNMMAPISYFHNSLSSSTTDESKGITVSARSFSEPGYVIPAFRTTQLTSPSAGLIDSKSSSRQDPSRSISLEIFRSGVVLVRQLSRGLLVGKCLQVLMPSLTGRLRRRTLVSSATRCGDGT